MIDKLPFDAIICLNGQYCHTESKDLFFNPIHTTQADQPLRLMKSSVFPFAVIDNNNTYIKTVTFHVKIAHISVNMPVPKLGDLSFLRKGYLDAYGFCTCTKRVTGLSETTFHQYHSTELLHFHFSPRCMHNACKHLLIGKYECTGAANDGRQKTLRQYEFCNQFRKELFTCLLLSHFAEI